jgi:hypothetical protein
LIASGVCPRSLGREIIRKLEMPVIPFSVPDLSPINQGSDAAQAFRNSLDLAQYAERWNFKRFWLAEHHNMPGIARW